VSAATFVSSDDNFEQLAVMLASCELLDGEYDSDERRCGSECGTAGRRGIDTSMADATAALPTSVPCLLTQYETFQHSKIY